MGDKNQGLWIEICIDFKVYVRVFVTSRVSSRLGCCMLDVVYFQKGREILCS